jgi:polar amino acid transport system substrate-binding protein
MSLADFVSLVGDFRNSSAANYNVAWVLPVHTLLSAFGDHAMISNLVRQLAAVIPGKRIATHLRHVPRCVAVCGGLAVAAMADADAPREIHIGMGLAKPPYIMESGEAGIDYEIANQAFAAAGYKMVVLQFPQARGLAMFRAGQLDGLLSIDRGIGGNDFFSDPYVTYQNVAITLASRHIRLARIEDLAKYSVAAFQNANAVLGESFKLLATGHPQYKEYAQQIQQDKMLYSGRVDVVIGDRLIFLYYSKRLDPAINSDQEVEFHAIFPPNPRLAVFRDREARDKFNAGLKIIRHNGTYDAILRKYQEFRQAK